MDLSGIPRLCRQRAEFPGYCQMAPYPRGAPVLMCCSWLAKVALVAPPYLRRSPLPQPLMGYGALSSVSMTGQRCNVCALTVMAPT